jgi:hypothetical protein
MTIELFDFPDTLRDAANYERLGFIVGIDDPYNGVFDVTFDPKGKTDAAGVLGLMESCEGYGLKPNIRIDNDIYSFDDGIKVIDEIAAADTYVSGVGIIL